MLTSCEHPPEWVKQNLLAKVAAIRPWRKYGGSRHQEKQGSESLPSGGHAEIVITVVIAPMFDIETAPVEITDVHVAPV